MSLPPLTQFNRNEPKKPSKCLYYKFSTANTQKLMNPILSVNLKKIKPGVTLSKACDVMSSVPPPNLNLSKFSISRLSPVLPSLQPPTKKTARGYVNQNFLLTLINRFETISKKLLISKTPLQNSRQN